MATSRQLAGPAASTTRIRRMACIPARRTTYDDVRRPIPQKCIFDRGGGGGEDGGGDGGGVDTRATNYISDSGFRVKEGEAETQTETEHVDEHEDEDEDATATTSTAEATAHWQQHSGRKSTISFLVLDTNKIGTRRTIDRANKGPAVGDEKPSSFTKSFHDC
ncbi:hypothetical protein V1478_016980, partial [Vespula squamosa]